MAEGSIGKGILQVGFDPKQVAAEGEATLKPAIGKLAGDLAGVFAATRIFQVGREGLDELKQAQAAQAQLQAVIQSTGGAAGVTAEHVDELSQAGLRLSGTDDELIKQGETVLLGFTNIQNRVGAGHDIFDRASKDFLDLSVRMGGDTAGAAKVLGIALQDPEAGMSRLRRAGVILSDQQKQQVKAFQDSGDIASAQGVILDALETKVGGAAAAFGDTLPGKLAIAQESLKNTKAALVADVAPALEIGATAVSFLSEKFQELPPAAQSTIGAVALVGGGVGSLLRPVRDAVDLYQRWKTAHDATTAALELESAAEQTNIAVKEEGAATSAVMADADLQRVVSNESLSFSDAQVATALQVRQDAEYQALLSNDALIASDAELVAAEEAVAAAGAEAGAGMFAALGPVGLAIGAVVALGAVTGQFGSTLDGVSSQSLQGFKSSIDSAFGDVRADGETLVATVKSLDAAVGKDEGLAKSFSDAGLTTYDFAAAIKTGNLGLIDSTHLTDQQKIALSELIGTTEGSARARLDAAVASGQLSQADLDASTAQHKLSTGGTNFVGVLDDLTSHGKITAGQIDSAATAGSGLAAALQEVADVPPPDVSAVDRLNTELKQAQQNADQAFASILRLAPAGVRAQQGQLRIQDAQSKVTDAEDKLNFLRAGGGSAKDIAQAERDLSSARLDVQSATQDEAQALVDLQTAQDAANGKTDDAKTQAQGYVDALGYLNGEINGPTHDALNVQIYDLQGVINKTNELNTAQRALALGVSPDQLAPNYYGGANDTVTRGGPVATRAAGGPVTAGQTFRGAEFGSELLVRRGLYQAPWDGTVVPAGPTAQISSRAASWGGAGVTIHGGVTLVANDVDAAYRRLPDELRKAAYLAGVG